MKRLTYLPMCSSLLHFVFVICVCAAPNPPQETSDKPQKNPQTASKYVRSTDPALYVGSDLPGCPGVPGLVQELSPYTSKVNTGFIDFSWTPICRMTLHGGANLSTASGNELNLTPQNPIATQVPGPLNSVWYQPFGGVDYRFAKHWTGRAMWDYYGYHENASTAYQDLIAQRNFQGNLVMLSVRFAF